MYLNTQANDASTTQEVLECTKIEQISECIWTVVQMVPVPRSRLECTENYTNLWMYAENSQATVQI